MISDNKNIEIISKDSVFDILLNEGYSWADANGVAYDKLTSIIQEYHDVNKSIIVDIGLAHTENFNQFMSKMDLRLNITKKCLFTCSNNQEWVREFIKGL